MKIKLTILMWFTVAVMTFALAENVRADLTVTGTFVPYTSQYCPQLGQPSNEEIRRCRGYIRDQNGTVMATANPNNLLNYTVNFVPPQVIYEYFVDANCSRNSPEVMVVPTYNHPVFIEGAVNTLNFDVSYVCP